MNVNTVVLGVCVLALVTQRASAEYGCGLNKYPGYEQNSTVMSLAWTACCIRVFMIFFKVLKSLFGSPVTDKDGSFDKAFLTWASFAFASDVLFIVACWHLDGYNNRGHLGADLTVAILTEFFIVDAIAVACAAFVYKKTTPGYHNGTYTDYEWKSQFRCMAYFAALTMCTAWITLGIILAFKHETTYHNFAIAGGVCASLQSVIPHSYALRLSSEYSDNKHFLANWALPTVAGIGSVAGMAFFTVAFTNGPCRVY